MFVRRPMVGEKWRENRMGPSNTYWCRSGKRSVEGVLSIWIVEREEVISTEMIEPEENSHLEPECTSTSFENMTLDFLVLGTRLYVRRELADVIVFRRSVVLIQHLNPELGVTRHVLDFPEFIPHGLQRVCLDGRASRRNNFRSVALAKGKIRRLKIINGDSASPVRRGNRNAKQRKEMTTDTMCIWPSKSAMK